MKLSFIVSLLFLVVQIGFTQAPVLDFQLQTLAGPAFVDPVDIASAGDGSGRLFIVEKRGTIRLVQNDTVRSTFFLDVRPLGIFTDGECGLLGLAFHPDYPASPYIYVYYIKSGPVSRVARFTVDLQSPDVINANTEFIILQANQPNYTNHKAGDLAFGPDGYLYITLGDGGLFGDPEENGQDPLALLGKILRIDVDNGSPYSIPPNNPYAGNPDTLGEIWAMGMRNPFRISFDRETGDFWIGDVGQGIWEEIDFEPAGFSGGRNYGWDCYEGNATYETTGCQGASNYDFPIFVYPHSCSQGPCPYGTGNCIIGGFVYRGSQFAAMQGYYICADNGSENIWLITHDGTNTGITLQQGGSMFSQLTTFGEDDNGELYAATLADNLYRVVPDGFLPLYLTQFEALSQQNSVDLKWTVESVSDIQTFTVERSTDGMYFRPIGMMKPLQNQVNYAFSDIAPEPTINYYRLIYTFFDGGAQISEVRAVDRTNDASSAEIYTNAGGALAVALHGDIGVSQLLIYTSDGRRVVQQDVSGAYQDIRGTGSLPSGVYVVLIKNHEHTWVHKWLKY